MISAPIDPNALEWLTHLVGPQSSGSVALVGAGPGDPALLTVRGAVRVAGADVIYYDKLANPALLSLARSACRTALVPRQGGNACRQRELNERMIADARAGGRVVRLKGGDPFIFGRGGEEAAALADAGVPFEVVPGVTAGIGVPACAGVPITQRGLVSTVAFVTGHHAPGHQRDTVDYAALARMDVIIIYMGLQTLAAWAQRLIDAGKPADTPVAVTQNGTLADQRTVAGTLADIAARVADAVLAAPVIIVVGQVVGLRDKLAWYERRPLFGQRIINTRAPDQAPALSARLMHLGAAVLEAPAILTRPPADFAPVDEALGRLDQYDWLILTSANGVAALLDRLRALSLDARALATVRIAAVGPGTAARLADAFLTPDLVPDDFLADALADALGATEPLTGKRILLLRADIARKALPEQLAAAGARCDDLTAYCTVVPDALPANVLDALDGRTVDWITFTSSSTARNFLTLLGAARKPMLDNVRIASIGPITSDTLRKSGLPPTVEAETHTIDGLVDAIAAHGTDS